MLSVLAVPNAAAAIGDTTLVSVATDGKAANSGAFVRSISGDGRFVAFESFASNLVAGDTNNQRDVFVRDRMSGTTSRINVTPDGSQTTGGTFPAISADGRFVAFFSESTAITGQAGIMVRDRVAGTTSQVSTPETGSSIGFSISDDGRYVAFAGTTNIFRHDRTTGSIVQVVRRINGETDFPFRAFEGTAISGDGRFVAFSSASDDLVSQDTNSLTDVFVRDLNSTSIIRASVSSDGSQAQDSMAASGASSLAAISADGRFVVFESAADNLVTNDTSSRGDVFVHEITTGITTRVSVGSDGGDGPPTLAQANESTISADGRYVAFGTGRALVVEDTNSGPDIYVRDRETSTTSLISKTPAGSPSSAGSQNPEISGDGAVVAYSSTDLDPSPR